jgi:NAD(P)-dependent dehydrogenase (short-subunit alcohol dehydrogenase family)
MEVNVARITIVTGAASGIGQALARALVARGDTVVVADVDKEGAERTAGDLSDPGPGRFGRVANRCGAGRTISVRLQSRLWSALAPSRT